MKIGEVELKRIAASESIRCHTPHHPLAVAYFNDTADCGACLAAELLENQNARELLGNLLAGLIKN